MASKALPTPQYLRQLLRYEPETGKLFWRERPACFFKADKYRTPEGCAANWNSRWSGKEALTAPLKTGHLMGRIDYRAHFAHRVAWAIHHGEWPKGEIDHINHNPADNRIENLRDVSHAENQRNLSMLRTNKSGVTGVLQTGPNNLWYARIKHAGKMLHLGAFERFEDAVAARKVAEAKYGYHPNHGR